MIVGVTGTIGSGKGVFTKSLAGLGFEKFAYSDEVRLFARGVPVHGKDERENLQYWGNEARVRSGAGFWAKRIIEKINPSVDSVVDGFRYPDQVEIFRRIYSDKFYLVGIDAPEERRFAWMQKRGKPGDPKTWGEFLEMNRRDFEGYLTGDGQHTRACVAMADRNIFNNGSLSDFEQKVGYLAEEIREAIGG